MIYAHVNMKWKIRGPAFSGLADRLSDITVSGFFFAMTARIGYIIWYDMICFFLFTA